MRKNQDPTDPDQAMDRRAEQVEAIMLKIEEVLDLKDPRQNRLHQCINTIAMNYIDGDLEKCWEVLQPIDHQMDIELLEHELKLNLED
ncbi:hypothetical protein HRE53_30800 (plasmid) [Acaryochloris sp. 'Moss Beach']|uniref:hypothetical protein n=1 Tax=Acaryochloris sp. 'Moss Beach' TaxID=2740837 RepID=UPI001F288649|nr:hypothetical protein [Acaryochloris sp. 'Moss Beach']UJB73105.1 hypothetical protein HRE53_30800 [Acaryochloris sp. 'Moss Beach']